jgi:hypothetical protein
VALGLLDKGLQEAVEIVQRAAVAVGLVLLVSMV